MTHIFDLYNIALADVGRAIFDNPDEDGFELDSIGPDPYNDGSSLELMNIKFHSYHADGADSVSYQVDIPMKYADDGFTVSIYIQGALSKCMEE